MAEVAHMDKEKAEAEFGDVMFSLINAARLYKINPDNALERTNDPWAYLRIIKRKSGKCRLQIVGCQHIESKCISQDHGNTKHDRQWSAMQRRLDIISRTTIAFPILSLFLVNLCQRTFNQCRRTSNDRNQIGRASCRERV